MATSAPIDEDFLEALRQMPDACGAALGFDRLVMLATGAERVEAVQWTPVFDPERRRMSTEPAFMPKAREALASVYGFSAFRPGQEEILTAVLDGKDVLAVMPTGSGKSLCFQLPPIVREGLTLVVSPLIALMRDQVAQLRELGVEAGSVNSSTECRGAPQDRAGRPGADAAPALHLARETAARRRMRLPARCVDRLRRRRRSPLRLAMGSRLPARISAAARAPSRRSAAFRRSP